MEKSKPLNGFCRWYIYAMHGYVCEIMFTATWDFFDTYSWKLIGVSSIWAFFVYGTAIFIMEKMFTILHAKCNLYIRCLIYTLWTYLWEFSTGYILKVFDSCPWDYSHFPGNIMGLITLEYAIPWFFASMIAEQLVIRNTLLLQYPVQENHQRHKML
ncbi:transmembrane protein 229B [Pelodytes ibericus]